MPQGTIKNLIRDRGFGFILPEDAQAGAKDLFFHHSDIQGTSIENLQVGQVVEYDLGTDERRGTPKAANVRARLPMNA
jgi:CspA family cold shock protein